MKFSPTNALYRYMVHLQAKGGAHAKLAEELNDMMRASVHDGMLFASVAKGGDASDKATSGLALMAALRGDKGKRFPMSNNLADYPGVSKQQVSHAQRLFRDKVDDFANFRKWNDAGHPDKYEMIDWRNTIDDAYNDHFQAGRGASPEALELSEPARKVDDMVVWMKRRGMFRL